MSYVEDMKRLNEKINSLKKENAELKKRIVPNCDEMDFNTFVTWAATHFMTELCAGKTPKNAMWLVCNQAAMNKVWGGSKKNG